MKLVDDLIMRSSFATMNLSTLLNTEMSLTIEQFDEFAEDYPEMEQFYDFRYDDELVHGRQRRGSVKV